MADENPISPITAAEPPKVNPLATPASAHTSTLKLKPVIRKPTVGGVPQPGLKPGLKLPPKPGATLTGLKPGVRLPPKPGIATAGLKLPTQAALKPGIRLPPKPGVATAGLKLPTQPGLKPVTHPVAAQPTTATPTVAPAAEVKPVAVMTPVEAEKPAPAAEPKATMPPSGVKPVVATAGLKLPTQPGLKPVIRPVAVQPTPQPAAPAAPKAAEAPKLMEALKAMTQNLKSITAPIPQAAILHKTGIIADPGLSDAQKQAAKSKTARISLSDAMGVAPVSNDAPMKTIRIKRPVDLSGATSETALKPAEAPVEAEKPASAAVKPGPSITQRKTLKISRSGGVVRPAGRFGAKPAAVPAATPAAAAPVEDIADIPDIPPMPTAPAAASGEAAVSGALAVISLIVQVAACVAMGALAYFLYADTAISSL